MALISYRQKSYRSGLLRQVHETGLVNLTAPPKALGDIGWNGDSRSSHLQRQPVGFRFGKGRAEIMSWRKKNAAPGTGCINASAMIWMRSYELSV